MIYLRQLVYALAGVWLLVFVASFFVLLLVEPTGEGLSRGLNRMSSFMTWQGAALVVAMATALVTRLAAARGAQNIKLAGYFPLAASVFVLAALVALVAFQVLVRPVFS